MKKLICLMLALLFVLSLAACGKKDDKKSSHSVDIEYHAELGQIAEIGYKLGDDVDSTKTAMQTLIDDHGEPLYTEIQSNDYTVMMAGSVFCCYKTDDKKAGLTHIITQEDAYGFTADSVPTQIRDTLKEMGYTAEIRDAKGGEIFFLPGGGFSVLEYEIKDNKILFVFAENDLCATVIHK